MPESGASGSVGAPLEESGALPGNGILPAGGGAPAHLFRFFLDQASLRAGKVTVFCVRQRFARFMESATIWKASCWIRS
jgi:hypothetical protein